MKPKTLIPAAIGGTGRDNWTDALELAGGYSVRIEVTYDESHGAPWEEEDGHGPVSDWTTRDKAPGERVLHEDGRHKRYYDVAEAMKIARRDGWDAKPYGGTKGERAARAVKADFDWLRRWCNGDWHCIVVGVEVSRDGVILDTDYCGGIEDCGDYWKEHACETANDIVRQDRKARKASAIVARIEKREARYWAERDTVTA